MYSIGLPILFFTFLDFITAQKTFQELWTKWYSSDFPEGFQRLSLEDQNSIAAWMEKLEFTNTYKSNRQYLKDQVKDKLDWIAENPKEEYRQIAVQYIAIGAETCQDRAITVLNDLAIIKKLSESDNLPLPKLKEILIGRKRSQLLDDLLEKKGNATDPIEERLYYQIQLKDELNLPFVVEKMDYERFVTNQKKEDLDKTSQEILGKTGEGKHLEILLKDRIWQSRLDKLPGFQELKDKCEAEKKAALEKYGESPEGFDLKKMQQNIDTIWDPYYCYTKDFPAKQGND